MKSNYKILLYFAAFFVLMLAVFLVIRGLSQPAQNSQTSSGNATTTNQDVPQPLTMTLNADDEKSLKEFVKNFTTLYNNYSYNDFSNLTALGDYENQAMQQKSSDYIAQLQSSLVPGFRQLSDPQLSTLSYKTIDLQTFTVTIEVNITETNSNQSQINLRSSQEPQGYTATDTLTIARYGQGWLVQDLQIHPVK